MRKKCVTLWHRTGDKSFKRILLNNCNIKQLSGIKALGSEVTQKNSLKVRIFSGQGLDISTGDRLLIGDVAGINPPQNAFIITQLTQNFDVSNKLKHYRVDCE